MKFPRISLVLAASLLVSPAQHGQKEKDPDEGRPESANSSTAGILAKPVSQADSDDFSDLSNDTGDGTLPVSNVNDRDTTGDDSNKKKYGIKNSELQGEEDVLAPTFPIEIWIWTFVYLLVFLGVLYYLNKKGFLGRLRRTSAGRLKIKDQIMLGNRQFLVVVEYGTREVLVGVGPGFIRQVCDLCDAPQEKTKQFEAMVADNLDATKEDE